MIAEELRLHIEDSLGMAPTREQGEAIRVFCQFLLDRSSHCVMILRGAAGTGKTTLAAAFVRSLIRMGQKVVLLAPTGRAAKVLATNSGQAAYTIHRRIYRQRTAGDLSSFNLNYNSAQDTLFLIDEASMIANEGFSGSVFGEGRLLDDLVRFVYGGNNCRMILVGDAAQLPPVGEQSSPALQTDTLTAMGLSVYEATLSEVLRQSQQSGILWNATRLRLMPSSVLPRIRFWAFADISIVRGDELIEQLNSSYAAVGIDDTIVLTRSNKRCNIYNRGIRSTILDREEELCRGDQLMIVKNNYFWTRKLALECNVLESEKEEPKSQTHVSSPASRSIGFLANGDHARVLRVRNSHELYGFRFAEVTFVLPDYDDLELTATVLLDTLSAEAPALTAEQQQSLYERVMQDYADISRKDERMKQLRQDAHYNALQMKFAYAVTCHKAQGGQWAHVYVDQGYMTDDMLGDDYIHWLYTAFTRASEHLYLVNWPKAQVEPETKSGATLLE